MSKKSWEWQWGTPSRWEHYSSLDDYYRVQEGLWARWAGDKDKNLLIDKACMSEVVYTMENRGRSLIINTEDKRLYVSYGFDGRKLIPYYKGSGGVRYVTFWSRSIWVPCYE